MSRTPIKTSSLAIVDQGMRRRPEGRTIRGTQTGTSNSNDMIWSGEIEEGQPGATLEQST